MGFCAFFESCSELEQFAVSKPCSPQPPVSPLASLGGDKPQADGQSPFKSKIFTENLSVNNKSNNRIFGMAFSKVYPLYIQKAERKDRTKAEVDQIIRWLTGYTQAGLQKQIK